MADPAAAYLVPADHRANRKNGRANPDDRGGFFLGNEWRRLHVRPTAPQTIRSSKDW
jgi:hypothetical protein